MKSKSLAAAIRLIVSVAVCQGAGLVGSAFTAPAIPTWYATLAKPFFNPPNWVFAPVWTTLYVLMGISAFLVWNKGLAERNVRIGLIVFLVQLVLNSLWSIAFFGFRSPLAGLFVIALLWVVILATIIRFFSISRAAAILLMPYILWVSFAFVLNTSLYLLNR